MLFISDDEKLWKRPNLIAVTLSCYLMTLVTFRTSRADQNTNRLFHLFAHDLNNGTSAIAFVSSDKPCIFQPLDLPLASGSHRVNVYLPYSAITGLGGSDGRAIFAARIKHVKSPYASPYQWHILLDPESVYLFTSDVHCRQVGLDPDSYPDVRAIIDGQRDFVAQSPDWAARGDRVSWPQAFANMKEGQE